MALAKLDGLLVSYRPLAHSSALACRTRLEPEGAEDEPDPTAELKRLAEENAELRRQLAASSTKGGDA